MDGVGCTDDLEWICTKWYLSLLLDVAELISRVWQGRGVEMLFVPSRKSRYFKYSTSTLFSPSTLLFILCRFQILQTSSLPKAPHPTPTNKSSEDFKFGWPSEPPFKWNEKQTHASPQEQWAKSYVCKMVKNESFHLWKMNTSDLAKCFAWGKSSACEFANRLLLEKAAPRPPEAKKSQAERWQVR